MNIICCSGCQRTNDMTDLKKLKSGRWVCRVCRREEHFRYVEQSVVEDEALGDELVD